MAKAVTLKDKDGNELYPVTTIDLVNGASQPTVTTVAATASSWFAPVWYKREYTDGRIVYTCYCQSPNLSFTANGWGWGGALIFPDSVTYNPAKMAVSACAVTGDSALSVSYAVLDGQNGVSICWSNRYGGAISNIKVTINATLEIFPY